MKIEVLQVWKDVLTVFLVLMMLIISSQAFALGSGSDELRQGDATFEGEPTASLFEINWMDPDQARRMMDTTDQAGRMMDTDHAGRLLDMGADPGLLGASGYTGADSPGTVEAATSKNVTLSAPIRDPSGVTGTVDFTFEIESPPDVLDLPVGDVLVGFPATFPTQTVTLGEETSSIPEPATLVLVGLGVIGLALLRRIWGRKTHP